MKQEYQHIDIKGIKQYQGISYTETEINNVFPKQIKKKLLDTEGTNELTNKFQDDFNNLKTTDFDDTFLVNVFKLDDIITEHKPWRIGEAFAEYHIETNLPAKFYYNELRDARNVFGNKTGADLLGFIELKGETVFLFGEVKTSNDKNAPPNVLYSRKNKNGKLEKGMIDQLRELATKTKTTRQLIRNIAFKVVNLEKSNPFRKEFLEALKNYNFDKYQLIGVLVRDTAPNEKDLKARFKNLSNSITDKIGLNLIALYIPIKMENWNNLIVN